MHAQHTEWIVSYLPFHFNQYTAHTHKSISHCVFVCHSCWKCFELNAMSKGFTQIGYMPKKINSDRSPPECRARNEFRAIEKCQMVPARKSICFWNISWLVIFLSPCVHFRFDAYERIFLHLEKCAYPPDFLSIFVNSVQSCTSLLTKITWNDWAFIETFHCCDEKFVWFLAYHDVVSFGSTTLIVNLANRSRHRSIVQWILKEKPDWFGQKSGESS